MEVMSAACLVSVRLRIKHCEIVDVCVCVCRLCVCTQDQSTVSSSVSAGVSIPQTHCRRATVSTQQTFEAEGLRLLGVSLSCRLSVERVNAPHTGVTWIRTALASLAGYKVAPAPIHVISSVWHRVDFSNCASFSTFLNPENHLACQCQDLHSH